MAKATRKAAPKKAATKKAAPKKSGTKSRGPGRSRSPRKTNIVPPGAQAWERGEAVQCELDESNQE
jgi:hypothetical protein